MKYVCQVCGYTYDEEKEGVPFEQLPEDWKCPLCKAPKSEFAPMPEEAPKGDAEGAGAGASTQGAAPAGSGGDPVPQVSVSDADHRKLTPGQLAALCTNLARGCSKQYKEDEAALFTKLAEHFTAETSPVEDATVEELSKLLLKDIDDYLKMREVADASKDRGAARALVWGEKVTRMLSSLVERYLKEGEAMLADTEVWLCTACGFVFVGDAPPEKCPVCRVPSDQFQKIEGRKAS